MIHLKKCVVLRLSCIIFLWELFEKIKFFPLYPIVWGTVGHCMGRSGTHVFFSKYIKIGWLKNVWSTTSKPKLPLSNTGYQQRETGHRKVPHFNPRTTKVTANLELLMCDKLSHLHFKLFRLISTHFAVRSLTAWIQFHACAEQYTNGPIKMRLLRKLHFWLQYRSCQIKPERKN